MARSFKTLHSDGVSVNTSRANPENLESPHYLDFALAATAARPKPKQKGKKPRLFQLTLEVVKASAPFYNVPIVVDHEMVKAKNEDKKLFLLLGFVESANSQRQRHCYIFVFAFLVYLQRCRDAV